MSNITFGYAGKWYPNYTAVQEAAYLVKSDPTPVGVEMYPGGQNFRVVSNNEYQQALLGGRLTWTA